MQVNVKKITLLYALFVIISLVAIGRIIDLQFIHKPSSNDLVRKTTRNDVIECTRGSILSDDGRYLAFSIPEYRLAIDPAQAKDTLFNNGIDELSKKLSGFYKDKKASEYKKMIVTARNSGKRYLYINRQLLTYQQMLEVSSFPILREGKMRGGLQFEKIDHRTYPYDRLAYRTLGYIRDQSERPKIGIEGSCDSILRGTEGSQPMRLTEHSNWIADSERPAIDPVDGMDVQLTLNIDYQEVAQRALLNTLSKTDQLSAGTVVVMEVATGEIKVMVNLEKKGNQFDETYNYAVGRIGEPGSVFKAATMTVLLEDKRISSVDQEVPAIAHYVFQGRALPVDDHLIGMSSISVRHGFEVSSNNVFRMLAGENYGSNPQEFVDKLSELKIAENFDFDLEGLGKARIKSPQDKSWSPTDLPQIGMGYTVELTPLHTLNFYNAIANGGTMVKPHLVRNYQKNGVILKEFPTEVMAKVASGETASQVQKAMRGVVENGTGKAAFNGCPVNVAGKTGTARIVFPGSGKYIDNDGNLMHQATFVGYFPYEQPKYSMIVVVYSAPTKSNFYGATWAGPVFREVAEAIYASSADWYEPVRNSGRKPEISEFHYLDADASSNEAPEVLGMGLSDALYLLEGLGYEVEFEGKGKVARQSADTDSLTGKKNIKLTLKDI